MAKFLEIARLLIALFPIVLDAIRAVEAALPEAGQGSTKLALVKATLGSAYEKMEDAKLTFDELWPSVQSLISSFVAIFNNSGLFKKN